MEIFIISTVLCQNGVHVEYLDASDTDETDGSDNKEKEKEKKTKMLVIPLEFFKPGKVFDRESFISWSSRSTSPFKGKFQNVGRVIYFADEMEHFWKA